MWLKLTIFNCLADIKKPYSFILLTQIPSKLLILLTKNHYKNQCNNNESEEQFYCKTQFVYVFCSQCSVCCWYYCVDAAVFKEDLEQDSRTPCCWHQEMHHSLSLLQPTTQTIGFTSPQLSIKLLPKGPGQGSLKHKAC